MLFARLRGRKNNQLCLVSTKSNWLTIYLFAEKYLHRIETLHTILHSNAVVSLDLIFSHELNCDLSMDFCTMDEWTFHEKHLFTQFSIALWITHTVSLFRSKINYLHSKITDRNNYLIGNREEAQNRALIVLIERRNDYLKSKLNWILAKITKFVWLRRKVRFCIAIFVLSYTFLLY